MSESVKENAKDTSAGSNAQVDNPIYEISGQNGEISEDNIMSPKTTLKRIKKSSSKHRRHSEMSKKSKRRRCEYSSNSDSESSVSEHNSSSSSDSGTESSDSDHKEEQHQRFKVTTEEEKSKYSLTKSMASYANEQFEVFIPDKELKEAVLMQNPVPENIDPTKKLDDFVRSILKEKRKTGTEVINQDNVLEKVQTKIREIMGPLSRVWKIVEEARESSDRKVTISLDELQSFVEQTVIMVGQSSNTASYHRRLNILQCLTDSQSQAKEMLREKAELLQKHDINLLGKKFRKHIISSTKSKKTAIEAFSKNFKKRKYADKPFSETPRQHQGRSVKGRYAVLSTSNKTGGYQNNQQQRWQRGSGYQQNQQRSQWQRNGKYGKSTIGKESSQGCLGLHTSSGGETQTSSSNNKEFILSKNKSKSSSSRKTKILCASLGKGYKRSRNIILSKGVQNTPFRKTVSKQSAPKTIYEKRAKRTSSSGNRDNVEKRGSSLDRKNSRGIHKQFVPSREEGRRTASCDKSEKSEFFRTLRTFQDGGFTINSSYVEEGRFSMQARSQGRLLLPSSPQGLVPICEISVGRQPLSVHLPLFWVGPSSQDIYQTSESANGNFKEIEYNDHNIHRRHVNYRQDKGRDSDGKRYCDLFSPTFGLPLQPKEVCVYSLSGNRIFRSNNQFSVLDSVSPYGQGIAGAELLQRDVQEEYHIDFRINQTFGSVVFNHPSNSSSSSAVTQPAKPANSEFEDEKVLSITNFANPHGQGGTPLVDPKPCSFKWQISDSIPSWSSSNSNGCLPNRLGSSLQRCSDRGNMECRRENSSHQCVRANICETSTPVISQIIQLEIDTFSDRQQNSPILSPEDGRDSQSSHEQSIQRNLVNIIKQEHNYNRRVSSQFSQSDSRLGVSSSHGFLRLEALSSHLQKNMFPLWPSNSRSICLSTLPPVSKLSFVEARSILQGSGCNATPLVTTTRTQSVCVPSICYDSKGLEQGLEGSSTYNDSDHAGVAVANLVSWVAPTVCDKPANSTSSTQLTIERESGKASPNRDKQPKISGMENLRKSLVNTGLSKSAASLIASSRRSGSNANYDSAWSKFIGWCDWKQIDPIQCPINFILDYLAELSDKGYAYRTINSHRSAISAYHGEIDGRPVGQHSKVCALVKGVFNQNPPQPRYNFTWDVQTVLRFIKSSWGQSESLTDKELTYKLVMLLALTSASRACTIHCLDLKFMSKFKHFVQFQFGKLHKGWKVNKSSPVVKYYEFKADRDLCVTTTLQVYVDRSEAWRDANKTQLLLSFIKPHKEVSRSTISRWIKETLKIAGINTEIFKGHSSRSAASTGAGLAGASTSDILNMGSWSSECTWQKFYNKPILTAEESFQNKLLGN